MVCFCLCFLAMFCWLFFLFQQLFICYMDCIHAILKYFGGCGSVYCETCISIPASEKFRCRLCQSLHPNRILKVCLELHHFLETQFPAEYELRKGTIKQVDSQQELPTLCECLWFSLHFLLSV